MTLEEPDDWLLGEIARLPPLMPRDEHVERVRTRCRAVLAGRKARRARAKSLARAARTFVEPVLVGGLCAIYLAAVILDVLWLRDAR